MLVGSVNAADIPEGPGLGQPASTEEIATRSINVFPDGQGLPTGTGSVVQGEKLYTKKCLHCHGVNGLGGSADPLAGAQMGLTDPWPEKTIGTYWPHATTLFDFTRRSMPMEAPGTLSNDETYALTAYLLYLNNIIARDEILDAERLLEIKMPNAKSFINIYEQTRQK